MMDHMVFLDDAADAVNSIAGGTSPFSFFLYYTEASLPDAASMDGENRPCLSLESLGNEMQRNANDSPSN